jgi:hypothetical protein
MACTTFSSPPQQSPDRQKQINRKHEGLSVEAFLVIYDHPGRIGDSPDMEAPAILADVQHYSDKADDGEYPGDYGYKGRVTGHRS